MTSFFYIIFLAAYRAGIYCYSLFNDKAKKWITGRKSWEQKLFQMLGPSEKRIWVHCASLGEFEQARPLIESLKSGYPEYKILLSFFSPSGYEIRKNYELADYVCYLPLDGKRNAMRFIALVNPSLVVFVKYEFWHYYLTEIRRHKIPCILISAAFRREQAFFKWYGNFFRRLLSCFHWIFLQDESSLVLLTKHGFEKNLTVAGDTRYDRVLTIASQAKQLPLIEAFLNHRPALIAGSTWPGDEKVLKEGLDVLPDDWKLIIAPHEIGEDRIREIRNLFPTALTYSQLSNRGDDRGAQKILIVDNIGMLSSLYAYGQVAFIGGGFQKGGIHNVLEPAVFGLPVLFGPVYKKFVEANELVSLQWAFPVRSTEDYRNSLRPLVKEEGNRMKIRESLKNHMHQKAGATEAIMQQIRSENWLRSF